MSWQQPGWPNVFWAETTRFVNLVGVKWLNACDFVTFFNADHGWRSLTTPPFNIFQKLRNHVYMLVCYLSVCMSYAWHNTSLAWINKVGMRYIMLNGVDAIVTLSCTFHFLNKMIRNYRFLGMVTYCLMVILDRQTFSRGWPCAFVCP